MNPVKFFKSLSNKTRLSCLLLIDMETELCVCELTDALEVSQPKISRHLANLRNCNLVQTRKQDQWVFYHINNELAEWVKSIIQQTRASNQTLLSPYVERLKNSQNRPCC